MASELIPQPRPIVTRAEAKAAGKPRYFTGKPCKRGHVAERLVSTRGCCECFALWMASHPGYQRKRYHADVALSRTRLRRRRLAAPDKFKQYAKTTYNNHKEKRTKAVRDRYWRDRARVLAANGAWKEKNRTKVRAIARKWAQRNPKKIREWQRANPKRIRIYAAISKSRRRARISNGGGRFSRADIDRIFKAQKGKCAYCRTSLKAGYHIDHIVALAKGGTNWPSNLQLCCPTCNLQKNARDAIDYAQSVGRLL